MKTLYLQCNMGAAGDMLMGALYEMLSDKEAFLEKMNSIFPKIEVKAEATVKCGITGTHMAVTVNGEEEHSHDHHNHHHGHSHEHHHHYHLPWKKPHHHHSHSHGHRGMKEITEIIIGLDLPEKVKKDALAVYNSIADAESHAHGMPVDEIHFHEVGSLDALADVVGVCYAISLLEPEKILCSPIHVGNGQVKCAHGILPVPAPATAHILQGIPCYSGDIQGELCTPTGAALLAHFAEDYGNMPVMKTQCIGYGMGKKEFPAANCVRAILGETGDSTDDILEFRCNLDDMTPEAIGFAMEQLFAAGALDVYTTAVGMKKNRPGVLLSCMCRVEKREKMIQLLFQHTTTLGIREYHCNRYTLHRSMYTVETECGPVRIKRVSGWGITREKPEYEDISRIAKEQGVSLAQTINLLPKHN